MEIKEGGDKIYDEPPMVSWEKPSWERKTPLLESSFFMINDGSLGGAFRLREVPRLVQKYGQSLQIAPRDFRAYTKYESNRAAVRLSLMCINSKENFDTEILL